MVLNASEIANIERMRDFAVTEFRKYSDPEYTRFECPNNPHEASAAAAVNASAYMQAVMILRQK